MQFNHFDMDTKDTDCLYYVGVCIIEVEILYWSRREGGGRGHFL